MTDRALSGARLSEVSFDGRDVLSAAGRAIVVSDADGRIVSWNRAAEHLYGWTEDEVRGRDIREVLVPESMMPAAVEIRATLRGGRAWSGDFTVQRRNGVIIPIRLVDAPILDDDGTLVGIVGISEDVTAQRLLEAELRDSTAALRVTLDAGRLGTWRWDLASSTVVWDETMERLCGLAPRSFDGTFEAYVATLHPEDRDEVLRSVESAVLACSDYDVEHRVVWPDGTVRWLQGRGAITIGPDGEPTGSVGCVSDVTELVLDRQRTEAAANQLAAMSETLQAGLLPTLGRHAGVQVASRYRPGEERLLLGGDFVDAVATPGGLLGFCIGDVSGHGPGPAAIGASLRAAWRALALTGDDPATWHDGLRRVFGANDVAEELFVTMITGVVDAAAGRLTLVCAGHPAPILLGDEVGLLDVPVGPPLGIDGELAEPITVDLPARWGLVLHTDGLFEGRAAPGATERLGQDALLAWLAQRGEVGDADLDALIAHVEQANGAPIDDDVAVLLLRGS